MREGGTCGRGSESLEAVHGLWSCLACSLDRSHRLAVTIIILLGSLLPSLPDSPIPHGDGCMI